MAFSLCSGMATDYVHSALCRVGKDNNEAQSLSSMTWMYILGVRERHSGSCSFLGSRAWQWWDRRVSWARWSQSLLPIQPGTLGQYQLTPPDGARIHNSSSGSNRVKFLCQWEWPSICRPKLRCLSDSVSPVYRLWLLMYVRGANTCWFYRLIDWKDSARA